jgi:RNA polymerase sigma-70 factor (ECF subfamily)
LASNNELVELASRAKEYDPGAFGQLFDLYFERLRRYVYYRTGDLDMAEEIASEVFSKALSGIHRFDDRGGTLGPWLYGIAKNLIARHREAQAKAQLVGLEGAAGVPGGSSPEKVAMRNETCEDLYRAISMLSDDYKDVVILRFIEGYDVKTVSQLMNKSPGTVRVLQHRAFGALRGILRSIDGPISFEVQ